MGKAANRVRWLCALILGSVAINSAVASDYVPRKYYGAPYEPVDGIFHGAGQTYPQEPLNSAFEQYGALLGPQLYPVAFMAYNSLNTSLDYYANLKARLDQIEADTGLYVVPQFGCYIPSDGMPDGQYDAQLQRLADGLKLLDRPSYLRIGYEFNGTWYNPRYQPESFKHAFRRVVDTLRAEEVETAAVWNPYPGFHYYYGSWNYIQQFYPGDEYVDWFGMDLFSPNDIRSTQTQRFVDAADEAGKPVLIGEATPRFVGADHPRDWEGWYEPFFELIRENPGIKGHTYINWDWSQTAEWPTWGNADLADAHPVVRANYIAELANPIYVHATGERQSWMVVPEPAMALPLAALGLLGFRRDQT